MRIFLFAWYSPVTHAWYSHARGPHLSRTHESTHESMQAQTRTRTNTNAHTPTRTLNFFPKTPLTNEFSDNDVNKKDHYNGGNEKTCSVSLYASDIFRHNRDLKPAITIFFSSTIQIHAGVYSFTKPSVPLVLQDLSVNGKADHNTPFST